MHIPRLEPTRAPEPAAVRLRRAHTADAAWTRMLMDAEFAAPIITAVRDKVFNRDARHLIVTCRRHTAAVRRLFNRDFPPYGVLAGKVAHP